MRGFRTGVIVGSVEKIEYLSPINTLTRTYPSNTTQTSVNRTFTKNSYVVGMAGVTNMYNPSNVASFSISGNVLTLKPVYSGYGIALVLNNNAMAGKSYKLDASVSDANNMNITVLYYSAAGAVVSGESLTSINQAFTVPNGTEYILVRFSTVTSNTQVSYTINDVLKA